LSETYGIMVYQEQVMQMAQVVGGYSLGGADLLRRAMGKKDAEEMAKHRQIFRDGAAKDGLSEA
jgi:DNA polymerase-3 subunit alpha